MRRRFLYLLLQLKAAFKFIPVLFAGTILFGFLAFCIGYAGSRSIGGGTRLFFKVAVVLPEDDSLVNIGFNMLTQMESLKDYCEFIQTDRNSAETMLKNSEVYGIVYIPEGFVEDVLNGQNTPAVVILPDNPGIETSIFRTVLNAGSDTLAYVQSGIYAMTDAYNHFGLSDRIMESSGKLNDHYIRFVMNRSAMYDIRTVSATGSLSQPQFYICSGMVIVVLFLGFLLGNHITGENPKTRVMLRRAGMGYLYTCACRILATALSCTCLITAVLLIVRLLLVNTPLSLLANLLYELSPQSIFFLFLGITAAVSFFFAVYSVAGSGLYGMLLLFCINVVMIYCSGLLLPTAYLPNIAKHIGRFLPAAYMNDLFGSLYNVMPGAASICACLAAAAVFSAISALADSRKESR